MCLVSTERLADAHFRAPADGVRYGKGREVDAGDNQNDPNQGDEGEDRLGALGVFVGVKDLRVEVDVPRVLKLELEGVRIVLPAHAFVGFPDRGDELAGELRELRFERLPLG